jgi:hypothetical protein
MSYKDVEIPDGKAPPEYTYNERRAELLDVIIEVGHPDIPSRKQFAERYDVHSSTVTRDIQALQDDIREDLSSDAEFITSVVYRKAIKAKAEDNEWMAAKELLESWNDWLFETGQQERAPDRMEMDLDASIEATERKALVGVDLARFEGVETEQMVGLDPETAGLEDGVDVPLTDDDEE